MELHLEGFYNTSGRAVFFLITRFSPAASAASKRRTAAFFIFLSLFHPQL
jgi:hypothetical protein